MLEFFSVQLRKQRWKTLFIAVALLLTALYFSLNLPDPGNQILVDFVRNDDLDIILLRIGGGIFSIFTIIGFISQINRDLLQESPDSNRPSFSENPEKMPD